MASMFLVYTAGEHGMIATIRIMLIWSLLNYKKA